MKAIILAGGYATRLRPISYVIPKLLFPVVGKPMVHWTLDMLKKFGVNEVILGVNYLADLLRAELGSTYDGMHVRYSLEKTPLGTAGPIKLASHLTKLHGTFLAMNGDVIADINIRRMLSHHLKTEASITDALHEVMDPRRFGVVELDSAHRILRFVEKPNLNEAPSRLANAGIYLIEPDVLRMIPDDRKFSLERQIFPGLARQRRLSGFTFPGYWFDIGNLSDYQRANFELLSRKAGKSTLQEKRSKVSNRSALRPPVYVGRGSRIESGSSLGPFVLIGKSGQVGKRTRITKSIIFDEVTIGEGSRVDGAVIASNVTIGKNVKIERGSTLSPYVQVGDGVKIGENAVVHPYKEVATNVSPGKHVM